GSYPFHRYSMPNPFNTARASPMTYNEPQITTVAPVGACARAWAIASLTPSLTILPERAEAISFGSLARALSGLVTIHWRTFGERMDNISVIFLSPIAPKIIQTPSR